ncbi:MAG: SDR family NAD(P)-dependent oxidoreductase [Pelagibacterales bacterium]|nr:SDR family NAD(P)-dependent oxidoreductase [Pelagibacterales bacterium]
MRKSCLIIGASNGIGEALVEKYFNQGFDLVISSRSEDKLQQIREKLLNNNKNTENKIIVTKSDVCDSKSIEELINTTYKHHSKIDLVIFCSAIYSPTSAFSFDLEESHKIIDTNLKGAINLLHKVLPKLEQQNFGHIAFVASVAGYRGLPQSFAYGASKAGLINLCEGIYPELLKKNINISLINPGFVKTRLTEKNKFSMPFIITPDKAAEAIFSGLEKKQFEIHFPKKFTIFLKILRIIPNFIFLKIIKRI